MVDRRRFLRIGCCALGAVGLGIRAEPNAAAYVPSILGAPIDLLIINNVTIVNPTRAPSQNMAIVVRGSKIEETRRAFANPPTQALVIDAGGTYATPGLWDTHVHLTSAGDSVLPLYLASGITSVRDMGGDALHLSNLRKRVERGEIAGPRIKFAGPMLESPASLARISAPSNGLLPGKVLAGYKLSASKMAPFHVGIDNIATARRVIQSLVGRVDFVKMRTVVDRPTYFEMARVAHSVGLPFVGHAPWGVVDDPIEAAGAGQSSFEHGYYPYGFAQMTRDRQKRVTNAFIENQSTLVPTLIAWENREIPFQTVKAAVDRVPQGEGSGKYVSAELRRNWEEGVNDRVIDEHGLENAKVLAAWSDSLERNAQDIAALRAAGTSIMAGTDTGVVLVYPASGLHDELELLVNKSGFSPQQALESATLVPAQFFAMEGVLGAITAGNIADIVLVRQNPLTNIRNLRYPSAVLAGGRYFSGDDLHQLRQRSQVEPAHSPGTPCCSC